MKYLVFYEQEHGCDYTIGCGKRLVTFEAPHMADAKARLMEMLRSWDDELLESLECVTLYETPGPQEIDLVHAKRVIAEERLALRNKEMEEKERQEFERLKQKFNK